jgi:hypothetical protein
MENVSNGRFENNETNILFPIDFFLTNLKVLQVKTIVMLCVHL